jgi:hypothetical protein
MMSASFMIKSSSQSIRAAALVDIPEPLGKPEDPKVPQLGDYSMITIYCFPQDQRALQMTDTITNLLGRSLGGSAGVTFSRPIACYQSNSTRYSC